MPRIGIMKVELKTISIGKDLATSTPYAPSIISRANTNAGDRINPTDAPNTSPAANADSNTPAFAKLAFIGGTPLAPEPIRNNSVITSNVAAGTQREGGTAHFAARSLPLRFHEGTQEQNR